MPITMGMVFNSSLKNFNPSTAAETEMGGVIMPSAKSALPPTIAGTNNHLNFVRLTSVYKENIPPSPLLSALKVSITYFTVVCSVNVQKIQEMPPFTTSASIAELPIIALIT